MKLDPALLTQLIVAVITMLIAAAGWATSYFNRKKLDQNTALTQKSVDNHEDTMTKLDTLATKVGTGTTDKAPLAPIQSEKPQ